MKVLVLHNNNLPFPLRAEEKFFFREDIAIFSKILKYDSSISRYSYDSYISRELSFLGEEYFDLIIMPYTFNENNYIEYSGLRVAAHIRLTKEWHHLSVPILYLGPDNIDDIIMLSDYGSLVTSYRIFMSKSHEENDVEKIIREIITSCPYSDVAENKMNSSRHYHDLVTNLHIKAPANYATHHSIANVWGIERWSEMLHLELNYNNEELKHHLSYKLLRSQIDEPQKFNSKWRKDHPSILDFGFSSNENYRIAYIDDEFDKGWNDLLSYIFKAQPVVFSPFKGFEEGIGRQELINRIESFVDSCDADCYILDLRLHESDFDKETKYDELVGHEIAKYIKSKNIANQIVVFTASNKVWNLKEELQKIGASGYVIKESPEFVYDRAQTYKNFQDFQKEILHACRQSYIKKYVESIKNLGYTTLDSFVKLLLLDKTDKKKDVLSAITLDLIVFIEDYVTKHFEIRDGDNFYLIGSSELISNIARKIRFHQVGEGKNKMINKVICSNKIEMLDDYYNIYAKSKDDKGRTYDLTLIIAALFFYYAFPQNLIDSFFYAKMQRNQNIAHNGNNIDMSIDDVKNIFENIVVPIIEKDFIPNKE